MKDREIVLVKCNACGCAITPELHEARSGELEMSFFVCPFCHAKYVISVTDAELRKYIAECHALKESNEKEELPPDQKQRMVELRVLNMQRSRELRELYAPKGEANGKEETEAS